MLNTLGKTDIEITSIIMGCWQIGGKPHWPNIDDKTSIKALHASLDGGINTFDTAPGYGNGHSEQLLGTAFKNFRDKIIIATKVFADKLSYSHVIESCENSLKNLQTNYIDLYQIHFPSGSFNSKYIPIEETMSAFSKLKNEGKIRAIGVSNFSLAQLQEACKYADIASIQPPYSLFWRKSADEITKYCTDKTISILAYSPLAQGLLTGKYGRDHHFSQDEIRSKLILCNPNYYAHIQDALDELREIARINNMSLTELSITWLILHPKTSAIVGIRTSEQAEDNSKIMRLSLSEDSLKKIDDISRRVTKYFNDYELMWDFE